MKKLIASIFTIMVLLFWNSGYGAEPLTFTAYLGVVNSSVTTAPGGTSTFTLDGVGYDRANGSTILGAAYETCWVAQVVPTGVTVGPADRALGNSSGATFTLVARPYLADDNRTYSQEIGIMGNMALSAGASVYAYPFKIPPVKNVEFRLVTGVTQFGDFEVEFTRLTKCDGIVVTPMSLMHELSAFATTGVTDMDTAFPLVSGTGCVEVQWDGDAAWYSSPFDSGVSKEVGDGDIYQMPWKEYQDASWWPQGNQTGDWNIQMWTICPPK